MMGGNMKKYLSGIPHRWLIYTVPVFLLFLFLGALLIYPSHLSASGNEVSFYHIKNEDGLSQNSVNCILQDSLGFMWLGTESGLNKYDGLSFTKYKSSSKNPNSLSNSSVQCFCEDNKNRLWIGTYTGLNRFNLKTGRITRFLHDPDKAESLSHNWITVIYEDKKGVIWIGTNGGGLNRYDREKKRFFHYQKHPGDSQGISHDVITSICETGSGALWVGTRDGLNLLESGTDRFITYTNDPRDQKSLSHHDITAVFYDHAGCLWVGTKDGLNRMHQERGVFQRFSHELRDPKSLSHKEITALFEDNKGNLWIGTKRGLNLFERKTETFVRYIHYSDDPESISDNVINTIAEDRSGILWVGTHIGGISLKNPEGKKFHLYRHNPGYPNSLSGNRVKSFFEDSTGAFWVGTMEKGLNKFDRERSLFFHYRHNISDPGSLSSDNVFSICEDTPEYLWIGTFGGGLNRFEKKSGHFVHYKHNRHNSRSLSDNNIRVVFKDSFGFLWVGTDDGGLNRFNKEEENFSRFQREGSNPDSLSHNRIFALCEDSKGRFWVGTYGGGLNRYVREKKSFIRYKHEPGNPNSLNNDYVLCMRPDPSGDCIWIGTNGGGLNRFDLKKNTFSHFTEENGLLNNTIHGILIDEKGFLWLTTNKGLNRFSPQNRECKNFGIDDGLGSNEFNSGAAYISRDGKFFIGGVNGFNIFGPEEIRDNPYIPPVVITGFEVFNKPVPIGDRGDKRTILKKAISFTDKIELSYKDKIFSFEFAALSYTFPEKNQYSYKMEGLEAEWNNAATRNYASYMNMPPGEYTFRVRGSNNDGVWNNKGVSLFIKIKPPFWKAIWFRGFLTVFVFGSIYVFYDTRTKSIKKRNKALETRVKERTAELQTTAQRLKIVNDELKDFAYIVSHDLKAPLRTISQLATWISADYKKAFGKKGKEQMDLLIGRVNWMANLIDGILQYSRAGRIEDERKEIRTRQVVTEVIENLAPPKNIKIEIENRLPAVVADKVKIAQVFQNLISNAMKYMDKPKGIIKIGCKAEHSSWKFSVSDNGPGIEKKYHEKVFKVFQTLEANHNRESTGVGLSVVKKIVEQYGGEIWMDSQVGKGTTFFFTLPKKQKK